MERRAAPYHLGLDRVNRAVSPLPFKLLSAIRISLIPLHLINELQSSLSDLHADLHRLNGLCYLSIHSCWYSTHVFPSQASIALVAVDVPDSVQTGSHVPVLWLAELYVDYVVEEIGRSVLAIESARDEIVDGAQMRLAHRTSKDS